MRRIVRTCRAARRGRACFRAGITVRPRAKRSGPAGYFDGLFTANICRELAEEVGLSRADLDWIRPVALCREFLRGGKPQLFFAAGTSLSERALRERRQAAIARQTVPEVLDDVMWEVREELCTLECVANLRLISR